MISRADTFEFPKVTETRCGDARHQSSDGILVPGAKWADPTMHPRTQAGT